MLAKQITIEILEVYEGSKYEDLAISEITFLGISRNNDNAPLKYEEITKDNIKIYNDFDEKTYAIYLPPLAGLRITFQKNKFNIDFGAAPLPQGLITGNYSVNDNIIELYVYKEAIKEEFGEDERIDIIDSDYRIVENPFDIIRLKIVEYSDQELSINILTATEIFRRGMFFIVGDESLNNSSEVYKFKRISYEDF